MTSEHLLWLLSYYFCLSRLPRSIKQLQSSNPTFSKKCLAVHNAQFLHFTSWIFTFTDRNYWLLLTNISSFFSFLMCQLCFSSSGSTRGRFFLRNPKSLSRLSREPLSPFINNVSCSTEESLILHPGASYKEKFRCRSQERGAEVGRFYRRRTVCSLK